MTRPSSAPPLARPDLHADNEITAATERLFVEISQTFEDEILRNTVTAINEDMYATRRFESALIPDLKAEYDALSACWARRDIPKLKQLLVAYFTRRRDLGPEIEKLKSHPN